MTRGASGAVAQDDWLNEPSQGTNTAKWMQTKATVAWFDRHGREWVAFTAVKNNPYPAWITPPRPHGWSPPHPELLPPAQYMHARRGNRIAIDYARWRSDVRAARKARQNDLKLAARDMYGAGAGAAIQRGDTDLAAEVGTMPLAEDFITAMEAGNQWALGIRKADGSTFDPPQGAQRFIDALPSVRRAKDAALFAQPFGFAANAEPEADETPVAVSFGAGPQNVYDATEDTDDVTPRTRQRRAKKARESLAVMETNDSEDDDS